MEHNYKSYAFFDVDNTLIKIKSMFSFLEFIEKEAKPTVTINPQAKENFLALAKQNQDRNLANKVYYQLFKGIEVSLFYRLAQQWADRQREGIASLLLENTVKRLQEHKNNGTGVIFVSGSFPELLAPFMEALDADGCLATKIEEFDGVLTGEIDAPQTIGEGKAVAVRTFLAEQNVSPEQCFAYGDDISDAPMLHAVGTATAIIGNPLLEQEADKYHWKKLHAQL
ncbi:HAD-IB family hydrolase [Pseudoalteromonas xiamenensis]|uniref:HAD family hydrolase n=1 Tax=Pseudoalteromonas xiamenensis TaxID=882626 RepID=UPI0027E5BA7F|nr:HAD-IB family hydrolase [Pseudoalteromonas xiamenensis]WMN58780.1 HAD-IB family hydrolase [Pseudoalteromonas xiamenensis]